MNQVEQTTWKFLSFFARLAAFAVVLFLLPKFWAFWSSTGNHIRDAIIWATIICVAAQVEVKR